MLLHSIRKFLLLLLFYIAVGAVILVLQFRNESSITKSLGALKISMASVQEQGGEKQLKNMLQATFLGISFSANDENPAVITYSDGSSENLVLEEFHEGENNCTFAFQGGAALTFDVAGNGDNARLEVSATLPEGAENIALCFAPATGYSITSRSNKQIIFSSQKESFSLKAQEFTDNSLLISGGDALAFFAPYSAEYVFSFESAISEPLAEKKAFEQTIASLRAKVVQRFTQAAQSDASVITEEDVMAYVAEMAANNKYKEAIDAVPSSFRRGSRRTFRTTPFFGNLIDMNRTLTMQLNNDKTILSQALVSDSLDIFTNWDILKYLTIMKGTENVHRLLSIPASKSTFAPTIAQAAGILKYYSTFAEIDNSCSSLLESVVGTCLETIEASCEINENKIEISENEAKVQILTALQAGAALLDYGRVEGRNDISATGRLILNTQLSNLDDLNLQLLSELYAMLVSDNSFYPHVVIIDNESDPTAPLWSWTIANNTSTTLSDTTLEIRYKFPQFESHYSFVVGVKTFKSIEIYGMQYRTDPRFETYNSSGYSYSADTKTLLLKTRHKEIEELIRVTLK